MSSDVASTRPQEIVFCHLFGEVQRLLWQSNPTTWCCLPDVSWLGCCSQAFKLNLFPPNIIMIVTTKQFSLALSHHRARLQKLWSWFLCEAANCNLTFLWWFWSCGFLSVWNWYQYFTADNAVIYQFQDAWLLFWGPSHTYVHLWDIYMCISYFIVVYILFSIVATSF